MKIDFKTSFKRDIKKITDIHITALIENAMLNVEISKNLSEIAEFKKIKGSTNSFYARIKIDTYRIGLKIEKDIVNFVRCLPRKDIYKYFP